MNWNINLPDKRCFKNGYAIVDNQVDRHEALSIDRIVDLLNEKDDLLNEQVDVLVEQVNLLNEQDRQLKRLFNYFQDYLSDEMHAEAFSEMFDNVKSDEKWD